MLRPATQGIDLALHKSNILVSVELSVHVWVVSESSDDRHTKDLRPPRRAAAVGVYLEIVLLKPSSLPIHDASYWRSVRLVRVKCGF